MKKLKQITALIGVIALAGLYVSTLVLALIGSEQCINLLKAAVYAPSFFRCCSGHIPLSTV